MTVTECGLAAALSGI